MTTVGTSFGPRATGWHNRPDDVRTCCQAISAYQKVPAIARIAAGNILAAPDDDRPALAWLVEKRIRGRVMDSWDQRQAGTCVSFGWGRGSNDLLLVQIADGLDGDPSKDVATEPIYGGSRVEVGGGRIPGNQDGSVGAWAAAWVQKWGVLLRDVYLNKYDLREYSESTSRRWGADGVPDDLEPDCRKHPIRTVAMVETPAEAWALLGNYNPIPICSGVGFDSPLVEGFCARRGGWGHCMLLRGRLIARYRGQRIRAFIVQNSWGDYLAGNGDPVIYSEDGTAIPLPQGCFGITEADLALILREQDSYAISEMQGGFIRRMLDWIFP